MAIKYSKNGALIEESVKMCTGDFQWYPGISSYCRRWFLSDLNECLLEIHSCAHSCHNTIGSYECSCDEGYHLSSDRRHCLGRE